MLDQAHRLLELSPLLVVAAAVLLLLGVELVAGRPSATRAASLTLLALTLSLAALLWPRRGAADRFDDYFALLFIASAVLATALTLHARDLGSWSKRPPHRDEGAAELYALLLTATLGMMLMARAHDLIIAFIGLETVSLTSYLLAGFRSGPRATEAALKYALYGGVASATLLYGMALLFGLAHGVEFAQLAAIAHAPLSAKAATAALVLCLVGFGYKIAAVPFHMWCPDVYEGAPTPIVAFLAVAPKAAGVALLCHFVEEALPAPLRALEGPATLLLATLALATLAIGTLGALTQTHLKRLFAYSSIAHTGCLLAALCAGGHAGERAITCYLAAYLVATLGAFTVILALSEAGLGEQALDYRGLGRRAPGVALALACFLLSLAGLPPLAGFLAKFYLVDALFARGGSVMIALGLACVIHSVVAFYFYGRLLRAMFFERPSDSAPLVVAPLHRGLLLVLALPTLALLVAWPPLEGLLGR